MVASDYRTKLLRQMVHHVENCTVIVDCKFSWSLIFLGQVSTSVMTSKVHDNVFLKCQSLLVRNNDHLQ